MFGGGLTYLHAGDANAETTLKYEQSSGDGDGPPGQNHALFDRDTFDFAVDEEGSYTIEWDRLSLEHVRDIGEGRLTNIFGWKDLNTFVVSDIDASPTPFFHTETYMEAEQFSNELRYNILLDERFDVTAGLYYFTQDLLYIERRILVFGTTDIAGGGEQETETWGAFAVVDYKLSDTLSLIAGFALHRRVKRRQNSDHSIQTVVVPMLENVHLTISRMRKAGATCHQKLACNGIRSRPRRFMRVTARASARVVITSATRFPEQGPGLSTRRNKTRWR